MARARVVVGCALGFVLICCGKFGIVEDEEAAGDSSAENPGPGTDATTPPGGDSDAAPEDLDAGPACEPAELPIRCATAPNEAVSGHCYGTFDGGRGPRYVQNLPEGGVVLTPAASGRTGSYWLPWRRPAEGEYWELDLSIPPAGDAGMPAADGFGIAFVRRIPGSDAGVIPGGLDSAGSSLGLLPMRGFEGAGATILTWPGPSERGKLDLGWRSFPDGANQVTTIDQKAFRFVDGVRLRVRIESPGVEVSDGGGAGLPIRVSLHRLDPEDLVGEAAFVIPGDTELVGVSSATGLYFSEHRFDRLRVCEHALAEAHQNR